jgi:hypothetical protein
MNSKQFLEFLDIPYARAVQNVGIVYADVRGPRGNPKNAGIEIRSMRLDGR